jgi:hypothetical protein
MNLQARIDRYRERGFQQVEAEILVLIEESAASLFTAFPDQFILFGGATLVLFYESPRLSRDLDLLASPMQIPRPEEIEDIVRPSIQPIAETLGLGPLEFRKDIESPGFVKQWVLANHRALFSIDLTCMSWRLRSSRRQLPTIQKKSSPPQARTICCFRNAKLFSIAVM